MILCHLIDVEQAGKTVFQFYNNAEFKDFYHSCTDYIIHFMVFDSSFPWIRKAVLMTERNSLLFSVKRLNLNVNFLFRLENIFHLGNLSPGHIGNMKQAFNTVQRNKRAVRHNFLHGTFQHFAVFISLFNDIQLTRALFFKNGFTGKDEAVLCRIHFQNLGFKFLSDKALQRMNETEIPLGKRDKAAQGFKLYKQADFDCFDTFAFNRFPLVKGFLSHIPVCQAVNLDLGNKNRAVFFHTADNLHTKRVSYLQYIFKGCGLRIGIFMKRKYGFGLVSERDPGFVIGQVYYLPFYNAAFVYIQVHFFLFQHFIHVFHNKKYLLYDPVRCGCTGGDANFALTVEPFFFQFRRRFNMMGNGSFRLADFHQSAGIGTVAAAYNDHHIYIPCQLSCRRLSVRRGIADRLMDAHASRFPFDRGNQAVCQRKGECSLYNNMDFVQVRQGFHVFHRFHDVRRFTRPFSYAQHFRVLLFTDKHNLFAFRRQPFRYFLVPLHKRTSRVKQN